ncbi:rhodanese-like domain-containing protein [Urechidicola croceus]|uniref:Sulfurtransferase n=1 Tax=Urechidicola croceus TaxID=1850246 RepID=A0A1D8PBU0_9FLAO|nr:rhodanese-like domain-containing protein [Urechidicola croceus]AOW22063.1 sulfurtransferase [Urechidicola croceus]
MDEIQEYLKKGAVVIDVRTVAEYADGHVEGSHNIVLDTIPHNVEKIKAFGKPIIAVCRSGARSGSATQFLNDEGLDVINGGPWQNVAQYVTE